MHHTGIALPPFFVNVTANRFSEILLCSMKFAHIRVSEYFT